MLNDRAFQAGFLLTAMLVVVLALSLCHCGSSPDVDAGDAGAGDAGLCCVPGDAGAPVACTDAGLFACGTDPSMRWDGCRLTNGAGQVTSPCTLGEQCFVVASGAQGEVQPCGGQP